MQSRTPHPSIMYAIATHFRPRESNRLETLRENRKRCHLFATDLGSLASQSLEEEPGGFFALMKASRVENFLGS